MVNSIDLVCFSHLRWGFVFQRPNHLMSRFARIGRVFFIEEPIHDEGPIGLESVEAIKNLWVCTPHINSATSSEMAEAMQRRLLDGLIRKHRIVSPVEWFYTPMALPLATHLDPSLVVYDCMDELSGFHGAPSELLEREERLFGHADVVFAGGSSLYESKRTRHPEVFLFPSSVDDAHFASARTRENDPPDQAPIGFPRVGFFGVIDERMDLALIENLARRRPQYQIIMIGPVVKISEDSLPRLSNIHYLGMKSYSDLPKYIGGWQVAMMPFALNEATRFISPTKTLEYLAAGRPIVSTAVPDVINPYGSNGFVRIADENSFAASIDAALDTDLARFRADADAVLLRTSWDKSWSDMFEIMIRSINRKSLAFAPQKGNRSCSTT